MDGQTLVVFPMKDRQAAGVASGDKVMVTLELDSGYREVDVPHELKSALEEAGLWQYARGVREAKAEETKARRVEKVIDQLR